MIALGRYVKEKLGRGIKVVFIGPCIAKKEEINDRLEAGDVDAVLTFDELRDLFADQELIFPGRVESFDNPQPGLGQVYPLGRPLKSASIEHDLLQTEIITVEGRTTA